MVTFGYELHSNGSALDATFDAGVIKITVPTDAARHWATSETAVSIKGSVECGGSTLKVLVEKDFECLTPREGENHDNRFPNPNKTEG